MLVDHLLLHARLARAGQPCLAMAGVVMALAERGAGAGSLVGDVLALGAALSWAGIVLFLRLTSLKDVRLEVQLMFQLVVSAPILLLMTPVFGPLFRSLEAIHWARPGLQIVAVASLGFLVWFWLLTIHKASGGASFSFLSQFWRF